MGYSLVAIVMGFVGAWCSVTRFVEGNQWQGGLKMMQCVCVAALLGVAAVFGLLGGLWQIADSSAYYWGCPNIGGSYDRVQLLEEFQ